LLFAASFVPEILSFMLAILLILIFYTLLETTTQTSLGKKIVGLILITEKSPTFLWLFLRNVVKYFTICASLVFVYSLFVSLSDLFGRNLPFDSRILPSLLIGLLGMLSLSYNLVMCFKGQRLLHDSLTGTTYMILEQEKTPSIGGIFFRVALRVTFISVGLGIAGTLILPNFVGSCDQGQLSSVKSNMHTLQTMLETYAVDWGGVYPSNIQVLYREANKKDKGYWKDFSNPLTGNSGTGVSYANEGESQAPGIVTYAPVGTKDVTRYFIYGYDKKDGKRVQNKGQDFYLTNS
jgi:type II secretory pathway pseudopilin PulG